MRARRFLVPSGADGLAGALELLIKASAAVVVVSILVAFARRHRRSLGSFTRRICNGARHVSFALLRTNRRQASGDVLTHRLLVGRHVGCVRVRRRSKSFVVRLYLPVILTAGIFWSKRSVIVFAVASAAVVFVAVKLDSIGALPKPFAPPMPQRTGTIFAGSTPVRDGRPR